jgi:hypothetical protein
MGFLEVGFANYLPRLALNCGSLDPCLLSSLDHRCEPLEPGRDEVLAHTAIWMNFENITSNERSQTQKATCCYTSIYMKLPP